MFGIRLTMLMRIRTHLRTMLHVRIITMIRVSGNMRKRIRAHRTTSFSMPIGIALTKKQVQEDMVKDWSGVGRATYHGAHWGFSHGYGGSSGHTPRRRRRTVNE